MRAAIYSRFSTDKQTESSIADQVRVCTEYANSQGWTVVSRFEDQGISGAAIGNRPGCVAMLDAAKARAFDVLLVMDTSRLCGPVEDHRPARVHRDCASSPCRSPEQTPQRTAGALLRAVRAHGSAVPQDDGEEDAHRPRVPGEDGTAYGRTLLRLHLEERARGVRGAHRY